MLNLSGEQKERIHAHAMHIIDGYEMIRFNHAGHALSFRMALSKLVRAEIDAANIDMMIDWRDLPIEATFGKKNQMSRTDQNYKRTTEIFCSK